MAEREQKGERLASGSQKPAKDLCVFAGKIGEQSIHFVVYCGTVSM